MSSDIRLRSTAADGFLNIITAITTETAAEAQRRHDLWPTASAAMGRALTGALFLASPLKKGNSLTLDINGGGPLGRVTAVAESDATVRGYLGHPHTHLPLNASGKLDVKGAVGTTGNLTVIKDLGLKEPYTGMVPVVSGEIAEDLAYYLAISEQKPAVVALGVMVARDGYVSASGGYQITALPGAPDDLLAGVEERVHSLPSVTNLVSEADSALGLAEAVAGDMDLKVLAEEPIAYRCRCSRQRLEGALIAMGRQDLLEIAEDETGADLVCHFCGDHYHFSQDDLKQLLEDAK